MDQQIHGLVKDYLTHPLMYFHEREIHCKFFCLGREKLGIKKTHDDISVHLLRYEYNTLWRYRRTGENSENSFAKRSSEDGKVGDIDFALLRREFVEGNDYLAVMNKEEPIRNQFRINPWPEDQNSPMIERGLEFKMAHVNSSGRERIPRVKRGVFNALRAGCKVDCRKLARERVQVAYIVAFSHICADWFDSRFVYEMFEDCIHQWNQHYDGSVGNGVGDLRLLFVKPNQCFRWGNWAIDFPHQVVVDI